MSTDTVKVGQVWRDKDKRRNTVIEIIEVDTEHSIDQMSPITVKGLVVGTEEERMYHVTRLTKRWEMVEEKADYVTWDGRGSIRFLADHDHVHSPGGECLKDRSGSCKAPKKEQEVANVPQRIRAKQTTYMLKLVSPEEPDYKLRITQKMLDEHGYPRDPWGNEMEEGD